MGLFRPYERKEPKADDESALTGSVLTEPADDAAPSPRPGRRGGLTRADRTSARLDDEPTPGTGRASRGLTRVEAAEPTDLAGTDPATGRAQPAKKDRPTPSRRAAEAARMERLHPTLTPKQQRAAERDAARDRRLAATDAVENTPERKLARNYIDARWHVGEFLMPAMIVLLALTFLVQYLPSLLFYVSIAMWVLLAAVVLDVAITWYGLRKVLRAELPGASTRGLLLMSINRIIQIRRFRTPPPVIKRGEPYLS